MTDEQMVIHRCPPNGSGTMPCCGRTPFEVSPWDRMTIDGEVTCSGPPRCSGTLGSRPWWMGPGQYDPCRCRLTERHGGPHWCEHLGAPDPRESLT